jgi:hypothetical protein
MHIYLVELLNVFENDQKEQLKFSKEMDFLYRFANGKKYSKEDENHLLVSFVLSIIKPRTSLLLLVNLFPY